ncbi:hypothetical protein BS47DRAFT_1365798 [Hydnum rufescens UP504]|uniref:Uncharacterized protein n=1 Tax=Hydnum rufescens UP504 TaxID=1448309 RepID=A0A9P6AND6_9AGAM|nr:hypothetical protein BS47DRAFT_1365798 [Hydnum rufescens UP504]
MKALGPIPHFPKRVVIDTLEASAKLPLAAKDRKHDEISEFEDGEEYMGEEDQDIDHAKAISPTLAQTNKTLMNGRGLQVKGKFLSDHARSRADTLKAEFSASIEQSRDEMNRARISEAPLNLSNLARLFGERNKHLRPILDMYDSTFAEVSENRLLLVQEVDNDVKRMSMVRGKAWKRSVTQARETIAGQTAGLKVWILYGVQRRQPTPYIPFQEAIDTSEYIKSFMQLLKI